jgi:PAS domain S-box-containing protein
MGRKKPRRISHMNSAKSFSVKCALLLLFLIPLVPIAAEADPKQNRILILHSYHQGLTWTDNITKGIYSVFDRDAPDLDIHIEYMDTKRFFDGFDGKYLSRLLDIYRDKYGAMQLDVIISSDDNALQFLLMHHRELFPGTPIVFCGINDFKDEMLSGHENITGVLEFLDQQASLDIALKLHPEAERVFIITDTSTTGHANRLLIQKLALKFLDRAEFALLDEDNSGLNQWELLDKLKHLPEKSIVYYSDFLRSKDGYINQEMIVPRISKISRQPVYTHYDEILGLGVVGGKLVDGHSHGQEAAKIAMRIFKGKPVSEIPVHKESINRYMFDYLQMKRFGISESDLPEDSIVINRPVSFYESLGFNIARRKTAEAKLKEAHNGLERRVEARTEELLSTNRTLEDEISERTKVEAELSSIYNAISDLITVQDTNYCILSYNKTVENTFGTDLKGKLCYEVYQGRKEICPDCAAKKVIETKKPASTLYLSLNPPSAPSVEIYAYPILDESGEVVAVVEHGMDVSEKMEMIEALKESEERFRNFFEGAPDAMLIADSKSGVILDANPAASRMMQRPHEEIVGLHQSELHPRRMDEHSRRTFKESAQDGKSLVPLENYLVRPDGTEVHIEILAQQFTLKGKTVVLGTFRDITERKRVEEALKENKNLLETIIETTPT